MLHMLACLPFLPVLTWAMTQNYVDPQQSRPFARRSSVESIQLAQWPRQLWLLGELTTWLTIG